MQELNSSTKPSLVFSGPGSCMTEPAARCLGVEPEESNLDSRQNRDFAVIRACVHKPSETQFRDSGYYRLECKRRLRWSYLEGRLQHRDSPQHQFHKRGSNMQANRPVSLLLRCAYTLILLVSRLPLTTVIFQACRRAGWPMRPSGPESSCMRREQQSSTRLTEVLLARS
jgi:hypothetical protein